MFLLLEEKAVILHNICAYYEEINNNIIVSYFPDGQL